MHANEADNGSFYRHILEESDEFYPAIWNGEQPSKINEVAEEMPFQDKAFVGVIQMELSELKKEEPSISITFPHGQDEGIWILQYVVEKDGSLSNFRIRERSDNGVKIDNDIVFVYAMLKCCFPDEDYKNFQTVWHPATDKGKPVRCQFTSVVKIKNR